MAVSESKRYELQNRYVFKGQIVMQTALHIGGGRVTLSSSNSPIVLTPEHKPFIPGSSFKGALRSTVEKIASGLPGLKTCALIELDKEELETRRRDKEWICSTLRQEEFAARRRAAPDRGKAILQEEIDGLCDTCHLFGSPFAAAHLNVNDLYMPKDVWNGIIQVRDGVAIDRDSEKAKDRLKYDFEVVPASATFDLEIVLENASQKDLQLICVGLSEFVHGFGVVGGKRSRGLGVCLLEGLTVSALELDGDDLDEGTRRQRLRDYLVHRRFSSEIDGTDFLAKHIDKIFA
ncbi:MAG TPA: CRISPR-associated RAMP protein Csx7 [Ktedonosporobacter sp.]|jgi:CRISPR-associated RAMP protein (TIGR02581 family)|nr:CRISPR-associated RAMP protein Csx7 [Ktedonosporobacter sp.]